MEIVENKALLLRLRNPHRVTATIPKSVVLKESNDVSEVLVNFGLEETKVLTNLGIKNVPAPIMYRYNWPGMFTPFAHQKETSAFLTLNNRAFCFNDPGTGKTASIAWAADYLMNLGLVRRVLIICPLSIMHAAWVADLFKTVMHRSVDIAYGTADKRRDVILGNAEFVVINFDGVQSVLDALKKAAFDLVVIDEANAVKTATTKRWKAINSLITPTTRLWMMTGTPAAQSPVDAYGLAKMLNPSSVSPYFGSFRDQVMLKVSTFKWVPKKNAEDIVYNVLQPAIRFRKEDCLDLPELLYSSRKVELTPQQEKYYTKLKQQMVIEAGGESVTSVNAAANLNKLLQLSAGCVYTDDGNVIEFDISSRYRVLIESIDEAKAKILVFVPFKHTIDLLREKLCKDGYTVEVVDGRVGANARTDIFNRFQTTPEPRILILQPAAASHGITLHAANTVVWWGPVTSAEIYTQANARVHRSGQVNNCLVVHLYGSTVEEKLYKAIKEKNVSMQSLLEMYQEEVDGM